MSDIWKEKPMLLCVTATRFESTLAKVSQVWVALVLSVAASIALCGVQI